MLKEKIKSWFPKIFNKQKTGAASKSLDDATLKTEVDLFIQSEGYTEEAIVADPTGFQLAFANWLKNRGYNIGGVEATVKDKNEKKDWRTLKIKKISEDLNDYAEEIAPSTDTTDLFPGLVCYVIEKIPATETKPWVTFKPVPRVIVQKHDTGVDQGAAFFSYSFSPVQNKPFSGASNFTVASEDEVFYSPLEFEQALFACKILNFQSKDTYQKYLKKLQIKQQMQKSTLQQIQQKER